MAEQNAGAPGYGWVKWAVIGGVAVVFMILFKAEIGQFLARTEKVQIGPGGVEVVSTPLGKTLVTNVSQGQVPSNVAVPGLAPADGEALETYDGGEFLMSWPDTGDWRVDSLAAAQLAYAGVLLVLRYQDLVDGFNPNVNVSLENVGALSYDDWLAAGNLAFQRMGSQVIESTSDPLSQGAVRVLLSPNGVYQVQRVLIRNGRAFVVTASTMQTDGGAVSAQMLGILNSFRLK